MGRQRTHDTRMNSCRANLYKSLEGTSETLCVMPVLTYCILRHGSHWILLMDHMYIYTCKLYCFISFSFIFCAFFESLANIFSSSGAKMSDPQNIQGPAPSCVVMRRLRRELHRWILGAVHITNQRKISPVTYTP